MAPTDPPDTPRIAVVGGGIAGLAAALRLQEAGADWRLFEASSRLGGVLETARVDSPSPAGDGRSVWLVERSADNFLTKTPWAVRLCRRIGIEGELLPTETSLRRAMVLRGGRLYPVPEGFVLAAPRRLAPALASPLLSLRGRMRLACEPLVPARRAGADESVASFARRRLGAEAYERLVEPLVAGIYTADATRLSAQATLPELCQAESRYGSLYRAARRGAFAGESSADGGARYSGFVAPRGGMQRIVDAIAARLPDHRVRLGTPVRGVARLPSGGWTVRTDATRDEFDGLLVAAEAHHAASILCDASPGLAALLASIEYASSAVVCLGLRGDDLGIAPRGFGYVVPSAERRDAIAASFSSLKFPDRAPAGGVLARVFFGGALRPALADESDAELVARARRELGETMSLVGEPLFTLVARWPRRMPQYHVDHGALVGRIERLAVELGRLALAGAAYHGVGVPQCVRSGEEAAERLLAQLGRAPAESADA